MRKWGKGKEEWRPGATKSRAPGDTTSTLITTFTHSFAEFNPHAEKFTPYIKTARCHEKLHYHQARSETGGGHPAIRPGLLPKVFENDSSRAKTAKINTSTNG
jgi:hypothetical protein